MTAGTPCRTVSPSCRASSTVTTTLLTESARRSATTAADRARPTTERGSDSHDRPDHRLLGEDPEQRRPGQRPATPAGAGVVAAEVPPVVEGPRARCLPGPRRVPPHRHLDGAGG